MKILKRDLEKKIAMIQSVVPRKPAGSNMSGILVNDGYLIANNFEISIEVKMEEMNGEKFIIPIEAFKLIAGLPEWFEMIAEDRTITINAQRFNTKIKTFDPEEFPPPMGLSKEIEKATVDGSRFAQAIKRVSVAISSGALNSVMESMLLQAGGGVLNIVGLDGKRLAWEQIPCDEEFTILVPKVTIDKLKGMDMDGSLKISYDRQYGAKFETDQFSLATRLNYGEYFRYKRLFGNQTNRILIDRRSMMAAVDRAMICGNGQAPVQFEISGNAITIRSIAQANDYEEELDLAEPSDIQSMTIWFDPKLIMDALRSLPDENISIWIADPKTPVIMDGSDTTYRSLILPITPGKVRRA